MFGGENAAKSTTFVCVRELYKLSPANGSQQDPGLAVNSDIAQQVTGGMVCERASVAGAEIDYTQVIHQEFGEFECPGGDRAGTRQSVWNLHSAGIRPGTD